MFGGHVIKQDNIQTDVHKSNLCDIANHHLVQHVSAIITAIVSYLGTRSGHL